MCNYGYMTTTILLDGIIGQLGCDDTTYVIDGMNAYDDRTAHRLSIAQVSPFMHMTPIHTSYIQFIKIT